VRRWDKLPEPRGQISQELYIDLQTGAFFIFRVGIPTSTTLSGREFQSRGLLFHSRCRAAVRATMAVRLTTSEVDLLKELKAAGKYGRRIAGASSAEIAHLIGAQYIKRLAGMKLYTITPRGQKALAEATAGQR
jgi:hypothetical protein